MNPNCEPIPNKCCFNKVETQYINDLPIDTLDSIPDYFIVERDIQDPTTGNVKRTLSRVAGTTLFPNANMANITLLPANNTAITVPENQVCGVYIENQGSANVMQYASPTQPATMLAVGTLSDMIMVQNSGFVVIPNGHQYIVGQDYWVGENGTPVTNQTTGTHLFTAISSTKLAVNIYYVNA